MIITQAKRHLKVTYLLNIDHYQSRSNSCIVASKTYIQNKFVLSLLKVTEREHAEQTLGADQLIHIHCCLV